MYTKFLGILIGVSVCFTPIAAQNYFYFVQFKFKSNTTESLSNPSSFLSSRAIARRAYFNIPVDSTDMPLNQNYVNQVASQVSRVHCRSKWMNGVTVVVTDSLHIHHLRAFPFVERVEYTGRTSGMQHARKKVKTENTIYNYGTAETQLNMLGLDYLHNKGYTGKNIHVAVLDAGFTNVNTNVGFDSLRLQGRLLGTKDFTEPVPNIYASDSHGANVLSIMAGNIPNQYLGAAPHASYWLLRTEYGPTEYKCETDFWVSGLEFADSVGVDVVNSSLGYTTFDDPVLNFSYAHMNGTFSRASRAATMAAQKGILVCNSAGNDGNKAWKYIGVPADANGIIAVGACTSTKDPSVFTSFGPTSDFRAKPDLSAMGSSTAFINTAGNLSFGSGTSYASPLIAGAMACFLQYAKANYSAITIAKLIEYVQKSAHLYAAPTSQLGVGVPNFELASSNLTTRTLPKPDDALNYQVIVSKNNISIQSNKSAKRVFTVFNSAGVTVINTIGHEKLTSISTSGLARGIYVLHISEKHFSNIYKLLIE